MQLISDSAANDLGTKATTRSSEGEGAAKVAFFSRQLQVEKISLKLEGHTPGDNRFTNWLVWGWGVEG